VRDLNHLYAELPALYDQDFVGEGFSWIDCHDADQSVISWLRYARDGSFVVVVLNLTPVPREGYRIGVPVAGGYRERFNSDSRYYGGGDVGNAGVLTATDQSWMGRPASLVLTLPPLAGIVLMPIAAQAA
jgi:1,4-alpha-glucan branching enzyme